MTALLYYCPQDHLSSALTHIIKTPTWKARSPAGDMGQCYAACQQNLLCVFSAAVREREKLDAMFFPTFGYSLKVFISNVWLVIKWCFVQKGHSCCEFVWLLFAVRLLCVHVCTYELFRTVCIKTFEQIHSLWMDEKGSPADLWDTAIHHHQMAQFVQS